MSDLEDEIRPKKYYFAPMFLDNPIIDSLRGWVCHKLGIKDETYPKGEEIWRVSDPPLRLPKYLVEIQRVIRDYKEYQPLQPEHYPQVFHQWIYNESWIQPHEIAKSVSSEIYSASRIGLRKWSGINIPQREITLSRWSLYYYSRWIAWQDIVDSYVKERANKPNSLFQYTTSLISVKEAGSLLWVETKSGEKRIIIYDQLLMIKDALQFRLHAFIARSVIYSKEENYDNHFQKHFLWQEMCLIKYGNKGYELAKSTEAMCKTYGSLISGDIFGTEGAYPRMLEKMRQKERKFGEIDEFLTDAYDVILKETSDIRLVFELFGLQKYSGHPLINPYYAGLKLAEIVKEPDRTLYSDHQRLKFAISSILLEGYIQKHSAWPSLTFTNTTTILYRMFSSRTLNHSRYSYPLSNWESCRFDKIVDFDYHPNYLELMDDKSLSFYLPEAQSAWDSSHPRTSSRRLLLEMLSRTYVDPEAIVEKMRTRDYDKKWLIVSVHPKEREFKLAARLFAMMPFEPRLFFVLTEANIAANVFPYLPNQVITRDKLEMERIFINLTRESTSEQVLSMYDETDLTTWNSLWRAGSVESVGEVFEDLHGYPGVFTVIHDYFEKCLLMVRTRDAVPQFLAKLIQLFFSGLSFDYTDGLIWTNHLAGLEGIAQKLWTGATIAMCELGMRQYAINYKLLVQGDNVVSNIRFPKPDNTGTQASYIAMRDRSRQTMEIETRKQNQLMKGEECVESTSVISMSKNVYVNGVDYHLIMKFSRITGSSSLDFPSIRSIIGAMFSTSIALADHLDLPLDAYCLVTYHSSFFLARAALTGKGLFSSFIKDRVPDLLIDQWIYCTLILPSCFGGYPVGLPSHYFYKNGSDPLTQALAGLKILSSNKYASHLLYKVQEGYLLDYQCDPLNLLLDPYCLPLKIPTLPSTTVSRATLASMSSFTNNRDVSELIQPDSDQSNESLIQSLLSMNPLNPVVAHDILDCSAYGIKDTIERMFVNTRSIQSIVRLSGEDLVKKIIAAEKKWILLTISTATIKEFRTHHPWSIYSTAVRLRGSWEIILEKPVVGLTTYHPVDFSVKVNPDQLSSGFDTICVLPPESNVFPPKRRGPFDPYRGSKTREKRTEHQYKVTGTDTTSMAYRKLVLIMSQFSDDESFLNLLDEVGLTRCPIKLSDVYKLLPGVIGGNAQHRYASRIGQLAAYSLGSFTYLSYVDHCNDNADGISGSSVDYPIMIQEFMLVGGFLSRYLSFDGHHPHIIRICLDSTMLAPITNAISKIEKPLNEELKKYPDNSLAYLSTLDFRRVSPYSNLDYVTFGWSNSLHDIRSKSFGLLECMFLKLLRQDSLARSLADGLLTDAPLNEYLDVIEVRAVGFEQLINACSWAVVKTYLYSEYVTLRKNSSRWERCSYIERLASALGKSLMGFSHLSSHKDLSSLRTQGIGTIPKFYNSDYGWRNLKGMIIRNSDRILTLGFTTMDNHRPITFPDDYGLPLHERILMEFVFEYHQSCISLGEPPEELSETLRDSIIPRLRNLTDGDEKVAQTYFLINAFLSHQNEPIKVYLRPFFNLWMNQLLPIAYDCSILEAIRSLRILIPEIPESLVVSSVVNVQCDKIISSSSDKPSPVIPVVLYRDKNIQIALKGIREISRSKRSIQNRDVYTATIDRNLGRVYGGCSPNQYVWASFSHLFKGQVLLIVGVGNGGCANVALHSEVRHVYGLDLNLNSPYSLRHYTSYIPPSIVCSEHRGQYSHLHECYTSSGDWSDLTIVNSISRLSDISMILIDIESGINKTPLSVLRNLDHYPNLKIVVLRCFLTFDQMLLISADLIASGCEIEVINGDFPRSGENCWLFIIERIPTTLFMASLPIQKFRGQATTDWLKNSNVVKRISNQGRSFVLNILSAGNYFFEDDDDVKDCLACLTAVYLQILSSPEGRIHSEDWILLKEGILCFFILVDPSPLTLLNRFIEKLIIDSFIVVELSRNLYIKVHNRLPLLHKLTKTVPRLIL